MQAFFVFLIIVAFSCGIISVGMTFVDILYAFNSLLLSTVIQWKQPAFGSQEKEIEQKFRQCARGSAISTGEKCKHWNEIIDSLIEKTLKPGYIITKDSIQRNRNAEGYEWLATQICFEECAQASGVCSCVNTTENYECVNHVQRKTDCLKEAEELRKVRADFANQQLGDTGISLLEAADRAMDALTECSKHSAITTGEKCDILFSGSEMLTYYGPTNSIRDIAHQQWLGHYKYATAEAYLKRESHRCYIGAKCIDGICVCSNFFNIECQYHSQQEVNCIVEAENVRVAYAAFAQAEDDRTSRPIKSVIVPVQIVWGMGLVLIPFYLCKRHPMN